MGNKHSSPSIEEETGRCHLCRRGDSIKDPLKALTRAATIGHPECLTEALKEFTLTLQLDTLSKDKKSALSYAAMNGHDECVNLLLDAGADVNNPSHFPPILEAARRGHYRCVDIILRDLTPAVNGEVVCLNDLICQARLDKDDSADVLMHLGADMSVMLSTAEACLIAAVANSYIQCISSLVSIGIDVNVDFECRASTLMVAAAAGGGSFRCMQVLLTVGAHVNVTNVDGKNALQICIAQGKEKKREKCLLLLAAGEFLDTSTDSFLFLGDRISIPEYLRQSDEKLRLKYMCRERIRNHLLYLNPHQHLFSRVPDLRQPIIITNYLLYGMTLD